MGYFLYWRVVWLNSRMVLFRFWIVMLFTPKWKVLLCICSFSELSSSNPPFPLSFTGVLLLMTPTVVNVCPIKLPFPRSFSPLLSVVIVLFLTTFSSWLPALSVLIPSSVEDAFILDLASLGKYVLNASADIDYALPTLTYFGGLCLALKSITLVPFIYIHGGD